LTRGLQRQLAAKRGDQMFVNLPHWSITLGFQLTDGSFISALGGALSLYLGISIAMVFEFIELLIDFFINAWNRKNKDEDDNDDDKKNRSRKKSRGAIHNFQELFLTRIRYAILNRLRIDS
jgi:hypothetical protein